MRPFFLISDFNIDTLARYLRYAEGAEVEVEVAPFGQVLQTLNSTAPEATGHALIWTDIRSVLPGAVPIFAMEPGDFEGTLAEVDFFADTILRFAKTVPWVFVTAWTMPPAALNYGMLDYRPRMGTKRLVAEANLRLSDRLASASNVFVLDAEPWLAASAGGGYSARLWYSAKSPYANAVYEAAARTLRNAADALEGKSRRLVVVDLDDTLWGGIVGEVGYEGLALGGHDRIGEAFVDFQRGLKSLLNRGVQLAICSKNDEQVALNAIDAHPDMQLRRGDFATWRINWQDKAANIAAIAQELNLGLGSVVFLDDNPAERGRVRETLPNVLVPEWPSDPVSYPAALATLGCFDSGALTDEDRERGRMYAAERERKTTLVDAGNFENWLENLGLTVVVEPFGDANRTRAVQLFNKTNQFNLSTRRMSDAELADWVKQPERGLWTFRVSDRFGSAGLTGLVSVEVRDGNAEIVDWILSCRVMGRQVEAAMLHVATEFARTHGADTVAARYVATQRNRPTLDALEASGFSKVGEATYVWDTSAPYDVPGHITLQHPMREAA